MGAQQAAAAGERPKRRSRLSGEDVRHALERPSMLTAPEVEKLLNDLCVRLGFCVPPDEQARFKASPLADARAFTDAVFIAEGLDSDTSRQQLYRQVRDVVVDAFRRAEYHDA